MGEKRGKTKIIAESGTVYSLRSRSLSLKSEVVKAHKRRRKGGKRKTVDVGEYRRRKRGESLRKRR